MEKSQQFDSVIALGKEIIRQLGMMESCDTLARWMVHHIAELIETAENCDDREKIFAENRCREAILALWKHIHALPGDVDIFSSIPAIAKTMKSLSPEDRQYFYFTQAQEAADADEVDEETAKWLNVSRGIDFMARMLISKTLGYAAKAAANNDAKWIKEIDKAFPNELPSSTIIRIVSGNDDENDEPSDSEVKVQKLENRRERLSNFLSMSHFLLDEIDHEIAALKTDE